MISKAKSWLKRNANLLVVLAVFVGISGATLALSARTANRQAEQQKQQQAAQRKAGQLEQEKLCTTFGRLAALEPPPGNPSSNPSRAYLQEQHNVLVQLGIDVGCTGDPPKVTTKQQEHITAKEYNHGYNRINHSNASGP